MDFRHIILCMRLIQFVLGVIVFRIFDIGAALFFANVRAELGGRGQTGRKE